MPHVMVSFDGPKLREYLGELVRKTVEDTLNGLLYEEADQIANAGRHERTDKRQAHGPGHCRHGLTTISGKVELSVPKPRGATFASQVVERHRGRETSAGEAMMEMCLAGVSTRRVEDVSEILWGPRVPSATASRLDRKALGAATCSTRRPGPGGRPWRRPSRRSAPMRAGRSAWQRTARSPRSSGRRSPRPRQGPSSPARRGRPPTPSSLPPERWRRIRANNGIR